MALLPLVGLPAGRDPGPSRDRSGNRLLMMSNPSKTFAVRPFHDSDAPGWDALVARSLNGTFMHARRYVDYHGDRFIDASLVVVDQRDELVGVLPAARDPHLASRVVSHPGLSYGGLVHAGALRGEPTVQVLTATAEHYRAVGFEVLRYKAIPTIYHRNPVADDVYALFRLDARRYRCDLAVTVDLAAGAPIRRNRRRNLEAALQAGLTVQSGTSWLPAFWDLLTANLMRKFNVVPAHSLAEMQDLCSRFPDRITCDVVLDGGEVLAGLVNYHTERTLHCQYSAASARGFTLNALDLGFAHAIDEARSRGNRFFDFGVCNEDDGRVLNDSLYDFKLSFGGGSTPQEFFDVTL